jgi:MFS family permease
LPDCVHRQGGGTDDPERTQLHLPLSEAFTAQSIGLVCFTLLIPLFGALSNRIGRKPIFIGSVVLYLGVAYPLFLWVHASPSFGNLLIMQVVLGSLLGAFSGPFATALAEQFQHACARAASVLSPT